MRARLPISNRDWLFGNFLIDPNRSRSSFSSSCLTSLGIGSPDCASRFVKNVDHPNRFHVLSFKVCDALLQVGEPQKSEGRLRFRKRPSYLMAVSRILSA